MFCRQSFTPKSSWVSTLWMVVLITAFQWTGGFLAGQSDISIDSPKKNGSALALSVGSQAFVGADFTYQLKEWLEVRASYNYLQLSMSDLEINAQELGFSDQTLLVDADVNLSTVGLVLAFAPGAKNNFRFMGGALVGLNNSVATTIHFRDQFQLNDYELNPERVGEIAGTYTTHSSIYPYLGIGIGKGIPRKRVGLSLEVGAYYRGAPKIDIVSTGLLEDNAHNGPVLEDNLASLKWHPNVSLRLAVRLNGKKTGKVRSLENTGINEVQSDGEFPYQPRDASERSEASSGGYPFITFEGSVFEESSDVTLDHIYLNVYQLKKDGVRELLRTGRFPGGLFTVGLEKGGVYEFLIEHVKYQPLTQKIKVSDAVKNKTMKQSFSMKLR